MEGGFFKRLWKGSASPSSDPIRLNLEPPKATPVQPSPLRPAKTPNQGELLPGNFFSYNMFLQVPIAGVVHLGSPKVPLRNIMTGVVRWGFGPENAFPGPTSLQIDWVDDPESGIGARHIERPEDMLGADGMLQIQRFRFERILDLGKNVVVYALFNPDKQMRMAYGFNRDAVELGYRSPARREMAAALAKLHTANTTPEGVAEESPCPSADPPSNSQA